MQHRPSFATKTTVRNNINASHKNNPERAMDKKRERIAQEYEDDRQAVQFMITQVQAEYETGYGIAYRLFKRMNNWGTIEAYCHTNKNFRHFCQTYKGIGIWSKLFFSNHHNATIPEYALHNAAYVMAYTLAERYLWRDPTFARIWKHVSSTSTFRIAIRRHIHNGERTFSISLIDPHKATDPAVEQAFHAAMLSVLDPLLYPDIATAANLAEKTSNYHRELVETIRHDQVNPHGVAYVFALTNGNLKGRWIPLLYRLWAVAGMRWSVGAGSASVIFAQ